MNVRKQLRARASLLLFVPVVVGCVAVTLLLMGGGWWARLAALIWFATSIAAATVIAMRLIEGRNKP